MKYAIVFLALWLGAASAEEPAALTLKGQIDLSNVNGRIDHFSADLKNQRVFMSALGNSTVEALDIRTGKRIHSIPGLDEPQGVLYDPDSNHIFVASGGDGTTKVFDGTSFELVTTVKFAHDADNVRYDARSHRIVVGYGGVAMGLIGGGALAFLDSGGKKLGEIPVDAHPESFQLEKSGTRIFVNVPVRKEIEVADTEKNAVIAKWPLTSASSNYPMALDEAHHRLFVGCRSPARMLVIDTESGKQLAAVEIVGDTDDLFYDASNGRIYVIGGGGFVDVIERKDPDRYERISHIPTASGARTGFFVPDWRQLFVAVPHRGEQLSKVLVYETK